MSISAKQVKELRDRTNAGILDCKEALKEADGDMEAAAEWLEKKGITAAQNKADRVAAEGRVAYWSNDDRTAATLVEINCETDFVARNDDFKEFVDEVTEAVGEAGIESVDSLDDVELGGETVPEAVTEQIATIGENINIRRIHRMTIDDGVVGGYVHAGNQIGVLVGVQSEDGGDDVVDFARDVAMHVAAMDPPYLDEDAVPEDELESQKDVFATQMEDQGKPEHIIPQIVEGKIEKWFTEVTLKAQPFVKDSDLTVGEFEDSVEDVELVDFVRFEVGEGIETEEEDFADEVADALEDE